MTTNPLISHAVITGGTFTQLHTAVIAKGGFDLLKESVAQAAFHDSVERPHPPRCHPRTRVAVLNRIMSWILAFDAHDRDRPIMWLNGPAGAGKSAIAQSLCERCSSEGRLLGSFFFKRSDTLRNTGKSIFTTLAYQICLRLPEVRERVSSAMELDPLISTKSLFTQYKCLVLDPLLPLIDSGVFSERNAPKIIVIDGLDECIDLHAQNGILEVITHPQCRSPLQFLITSRPEHSISVTFNSTAIRPMRTRLTLDNSYHPERDIMLFIYERLIEIKKTHPFRKTIPKDWPPISAVEQLVSKSSGQFIYAATAIDYISSIRHRPLHRLEIVLNLRPPTKDMPFGELDALYSHILSCVEDIETVLHVLSFHMLDGSPSVEFIQEVLSFDVDEIEILFCDMKSLINLELDEEWDEWRLEFYHASLPDFLTDQRRAKQFYVDIRREGAAHVQECISYLLDRFSLRSETTNSEDLLDIYEFIASNVSRASPTPGLLSALRNFPFSTMIYQEIMWDSLDSDKWGSIQYIHTFYLRLIPHLLSCLESLVRTIPLYSFNETIFLIFMITMLDTLKDKSVLEHHLHLLDLVFTGHLDEYYKDDRFILFFALIHLSTPRRPKISRIPTCFTLFDWDPALSNIDKRRLCLWDNLAGYKEDYLRMILSSLDGPNRLYGYGLNQERYACASLLCLKYLCDRSANASPRPVKLTGTYVWPEIFKRRNTPWTWRRRRAMVRHDEFDQIQVLHRIKTKNGGEVTVTAKYLFNPFHRKAPVVTPGDWMQKYAIGLKYLPRLLERSGRSEPLLDFAKYQTFNYRSRKYPSASKGARLAIARYIEANKSI